MTINTPKPTAADITPLPGFWRCLAAVLYDSLLLLAVLFIATALLLPFNAGVAFNSRQFFYPIYLVCISFAFYGWFWTHGGQTLGLRAWKLRLLTFDQNPISWQQALKRFCAALLSWGVFGCGFFWMAFDKKNRSWHDLLSGTRLFLDTSSGKQK